MTFAHLDSVAAEVRAVAEQFAAADHRLYLVGGIVRDLWLDRDVNHGMDLDLTTDARPDEVKAIIGPMAEAVWLQGERFGTIGALIAGRAYEITTHRSEVYTDDSRKPAVVFSTAIEEDLSRRDFTVNAMAVELPGTALIDPFEGAADMEAARLRTPLDPEVSFTDDPLRMLRAARFTAGYGLRPTDEVLAAMRTLAERLDIVSVERVRDELDKLLALADPGPGLTLLADTGLLGRFLPEVVPVLAQRVGALMAVPATAEVRLATLLYGTAVDVAAERLSKLRYSNDRRHVTISTLRAAEALAAGRVDDAASFRRWMAAVAEHRDEARAVVAALGDLALVERSVALEAELGDELGDLGPGLSGAQVMRLLDLSEGPEVGLAMDFLQELRFDEGPLPAATTEARLLDWWQARA